MPLRPTIGLSPAVFTNFVRRKTFADRSGSGLVSGSRCLARNLFIWVLVVVSRSKFLLGLIIFEEVNIANRRSYFSLFLGSYGHSNHLIEKIDGIIL